MDLVFIFFAILNINCYGIQGECELEASYIPGYHYVVGLYKMYKDYDKSEYDENAIRLHLKIRYFIESEYYYYSGEPIGYLGFNICNQSSMVESLTHILLNRHFKPGQTVIKDTKESCPCRTCKCATYSSNILAIFLYLPIDLTRVAINILIVEKISVFAFSRQELSYSNAIYRRQSYSVNPYIYSSYELGKFYLLSTIRRHNIKYIALINIGNFASELARFHQQRLWDEIKLGREICIQRKNINPSNYTDMKNYIDHIRNDQSLQMIVLWSHRKHIPFFLNRTHNITNKIWYWYTSASFFNEDIKSKFYEQSLKVNMFTKHPGYAYQSWNRLFSYQNMSSHMNAKGFQRIIDDIWISGFLKQLNLGIDLGIFKFLDKKNTLDEIFVESMVTVLWYAYANVWSVDFDHFPDQLVWHAYPIYHIASSTDALEHLNSTRICSIIRCYAGYEPKYGVIYDSNIEIEQLKWQCVKCFLNSVKLNYNFKSCRKCPTHTKSNANRTKCFDPYTDVHMLFQSSVFIVVQVVMGSATVFTLFAILIFIRYKNTPVIRASGFRSRMIQLIAHFLLFIYLMAGLLIKPRKVTCISQPIVIGVLLTVISAITITSTFKALHAFESNLILSKRSILITKITEGFVLMVLVIIQIGICGITLFQDLPTVKFQLKEISLIRNLYCTNLIHLRIQIAWNLILSFYCLVQAFKGRNLPSRFNESKPTLYSMLLTFLILTISFPISLGQTTKQDELMVIYVSSAIINLIQLLLMCSNKIVIILFHKEQNTKEAFRSAMLENAKKKSGQELKLRNLKPVDCVLSE